MIDRCPLCNEPLTLTEFKKLRCSVSKRNYHFSWNIQYNYFWCELNNFSCMYYLNGRIEIISKGNCFFNDQKFFSSLADLVNYLQLITNSLIFI